MQKKYLTEFNTIYENNNKTNKKISQKYGMEGISLNSIENIYKKKKKKIHGERLNVLPLRSRTRQECSLSLLLFNVVF